MVKNVLKQIIFSLIILSSLISCSTSPTYLRENIVTIIKDICEKEFSLAVQVWNETDTIWIYIPFEKILNDQNQLDEKVSNDIRKIYMTLRRTILSMDSPPKFYCFVISDIKSLGVDLYYIGFIPDLIRVNLGLSSYKEWQDHEFFHYFINPMALEDKEGKHVSKYNIEMGEFIAYLIKQKVERKFTGEEFKNIFVINELRTYYFNGKLGVLFDIETKEYKQNLPFPFDEALSAVKYYLKYYDFKDIIELEITDISTGKTRYYTQKALFDE